MLKEIYGGRGIDTAYERSKIDYNPLLQYISEYAYSEGYYDEEGFSIPEDIGDFAMYSVSSAFKSLDESQVELQKVVDLINERMTEAEVDVNTNSYSKEIIDSAKKYLGRNESDSVKITWQDFLRAAKDNESENSIVVINLFEEAQSRVDGSIEGLLYRNIDGLISESKSLVRSLEKMAGVTITEAIGDSFKEDFKLKEEKFLSDWLTAKRNLKLAEEKEERLEQASRHTPSGEIVEQYFASQEELIKAKEVEKSFSINPLPTISKVFQTRASQETDIAKKSFNLLMRTVSDSLDNAIPELIRKFLKDNTLEGQKKIKDYLNSKIMDLRNIQKAIEFMSIVSSYESSSIKNSLLDSTSKFLKPFLNEVIEYFYGLTNEISRPIIKFLNKAVIEDDYIQCFSFETLTSLLVGAVEQINSSFKDTVLEFYKNCFSSHESSNNLLGTLSQKKWIKDLYTVLDLIIEKLSEVANSDIDSFITDDFIYELMENNSLGFRYNQITGEIEKISEVLTSV